MRHHASFPTGHPSFRQSLPPDAAQVRKALDGSDLVILLGGPFFEDIWFAEGSHFPAGARVVQIEESPERLAFNHRLDGGIVGEMSTSIASLTDAVRSRASEEFRLAAARRNQALAELNARDKEAHRSRLEKSFNREPTSMPRLMAELRRGLPDDVVIVDESITASLDMARTFDYRGFGDYFGGRGGGIGQGLSGAIGVKVAMPDRPVVAVSGDGSAMYSIQALWTAAHHKTGNRVRHPDEPRVSNPQAQCGCLAQKFRSRHAASLSADGSDRARTSISSILAAGMGVEGVRVEKADDIAPALAKRGRGKPAVPRRNRDRGKEVTAQNRGLIGGSARCYYLNGQSDYY